MLTTKTIAGAGWTVSSRLAARLIDFVTVLVLARTLAPADFGLTSLAMTLTIITETILQVPLIQALTRLTSISKAHLDTAFTLGLLRGLLLSFIVLVAAWPFASLYNDSRLIPLVAVLSIGPFARGLYSPAMVEYIRHMNFRQVFVVELLGKLAAFVFAISLVKLGSGYWAIVANSVSAPLATTLISYALAPYRPTLSLAKWSDFSTFLGWFTTSQVTSTISWQFDRILLGYFIQKSDLGQYAMAADLADMPTQSLIGPAMAPIMAAFSRINHDSERLRNAYLKATHVTMLLAAPACLGMSLTSDLIIDVLFGDKWKDAGFYLHWLAISAVLYAFYSPLQSLLFATNRTDVIFRLSVVDVLSRISLMLLGIHFFSISGIIAARGVMSLILFVLVALIARSLVGLDAISQARNLWRIAVASASMMISVYAIRHYLAGTGLAPISELIVASSFGATVYICTLLAVGERPADYFKSPWSRSKSD
jgi:O-antigen/teichoic acid export membrane protein